MDNFPALWLGVVVPKRLARRAVTRNLIRRQVRQTMLATAACLPAGLWLWRLRAPYRPADFPAAASRALRLAVAGEVRGLATVLLP